MAASSWIGDLTTRATDVGFWGLGIDVLTSLLSEVSEDLVASGVLSIIETSGGPPERTQNSVIKPAYLYLGAQLSVTANTPAVAAARAQAMFDGLAGIRNSWIVNAAGTASGWYREVNPLSSEPYPFPPDSRGRARCGFTVVAIRRNF